MRLQRSSQSIVARNSSSACKSNSSTAPPQSPDPELASGLSQTSLDRESIDAGIANATPYCERRHTSSRPRGAAADQVQTEGESGDAIAGRASAVRRRRQFRASAYVFVDPAVLSAWFSARNRSGETGAQRSARARRHARTQGTYRARQRRGDSQTAHGRSQY